MEKDRVVKKDVSQQEVIEYFQQRLLLSRTGFVFIYTDIISHVSNHILFKKNRIRIVACDKF